MDAWPMQNEPIFRRCETRACVYGRAETRIARAKPWNAWSVSANTIFAKDHWLVWLSVLNARNSLVSIDSKDVQPSYAFVKEDSCSSGKPYYFALWTISDKVHNAKYVHVRKCIIVMEQPLLYHPSYIYIYRLEIFRVEIRIAPIDFNNAYSREMFVA